MPTEVPEVKRIIGVIHGGLILNEITQSFAKRYVRELDNINETSIQLGRTPYELSFSNQDMHGLADPHYDLLVITSKIANCKLKRVLIDNGSLENIMFLQRSKMSHLSFETPQLSRDSTASPNNCR